MPKKEIEKAEKLDHALKGLDQLNKEVFEKAQDPLLADYQSRINGVAGLIIFLKTDLARKARAKREQREVNQTLLEEVEQLKQQVTEFSKAYPTLAANICEEACTDLEDVVKANRP